MWKGTAATLNPKPDASSATAMRVFIVAEMRNRAEAKLPRMKYLKAASAGRLPRRSQAQSA